MKLGIVSFGHADSILHYAKTLSAHYDIDLIFVFALNKRIESVLNFENEVLHTGFLESELADRILGKSLKNFIDNKFTVKFFINYNLKLRSLKNIILAKQLSKTLKKYDIVHFNGMDATLLLYNYLLKHRRKVFTIHDLKLHTGEKGRKYVNISERFSKWMINSKYQVLIQNKADYEEIIKTYPAKKSKINLIPFKELNIFRSFLNSNITSIKSDILFFGRISQYKGLRYLIEAIETVKKVHPDVCLMIAGGGIIENELIKDSIKDNLVIHNRYISNEEMANFISNTKIVVCPYTDATQSGVVMTSFAFGKPVIASAVGGFKDVIEDDVTGRLIPPGDVKILADSIISLLSDDKKIKKMSENISERCKNGYLSWDSIISDIKKVYEKTLQNENIN
jgi:glycosyltransferase involved in cell wall biosynthesis